MVLTFRNVHNFGPEHRAILNRQVFAVLKSGGLYGVVDHTARHMEPANPENRRRIDPVVVIKEMLDIGFGLREHRPVYAALPQALRPGLPPCPRDAGGAGRTPRAKAGGSSALVPIRHRWKAQTIPAAVWVKSRSTR